MRSSQFPAKLFFVMGLLFPMMSFALGLATLASLDIYVHATYFVVGHFHVLLLSCFVFWFYGSIYYLGARLLALPFSRVLTTLHAIVTTLFVLAFNSFGYIGNRQSSNSGAQQVRNFIVQHLSQSFLGPMFLLSAVLFVVIVVLAVLTKRRQTTA